MTELPYPIAWKRAYLALSDAIARFQQDWLPPSESRGNVTRLLDYHLTRSQELLWSEVNGGLDEEYQAEVDALQECPSAPE